MEKFKITLSFSYTASGFLFLTKEQKEFVKKYVKADEVMIVEFDADKGTAEVVKQTVEQKVWMIQAPSLDEEGAPLYWSANKGWTRKADANTFTERGVICGPGTWVRV
jgi:hypothetical protein